MGNKSNNMSNEMDNPYQSYESKYNFILINFLIDIPIILILIVIFAAIYALYKYGSRKNNDDKREYDPNKGNYRMYNNYNNYNNNYNNDILFTDQKRMSKTKLKKKNEMKEFNNYNNNIYNNNYSNRNSYNNLNSSRTSFKNNKYNNNYNNNKNYNNNYNNNNNIFNKNNNNYNNINNYNNNKNININFENNNKINNDVNLFNQNNNNNIFNNFDNNNQINNNFININGDLKKLNPKSSVLLNSGMSLNDDMEEIGFILSRIPEEPKIGLANIGATCYMNATLQCFSHTIKLANFFLEEKNKNIIKKKKFSREFLEVLKKLWIKSYNKNKSYYEPYNFKKIISEMNPLFQGVAANDSKDLINFILQELHDELNNPLENQENNIYNINQYDEKGMFMNFMEEFKQKQRSIISDIFFFIIETQTECLNCKLINQRNGNYNPMYIYNFQIMNFLIFPLEEIRKYKIMQYQQNFQEVDLNDCFNYYQKVDYMQGDNEMWCKNCNQNAPSQYMTRLYSAPVDLILILNRGKGNIYNVKLNFGEILDIGNYVCLKNSKNLIYHLYAIVTHIGPSNMGGHFIAFCKSPIDNKWYKYNDAMVDYVGNFYNDIVNFGVPYILFYESQNY